MNGYASAGVAVVLTGVALAVGIYLVAIGDRLLASLVGGGGIGWRTAVVRPAQRATLLLLQQRLTTEPSDAPGWALAPAFFLALAAVALAMVPVARGRAAADPATGFVVFSAAIALVMIAVFLHGWSPDAALPLHGAYRYGAQALSFQIPFLLAMLAAALPAQSLSIVDIVAAQDTVWNVIRTPLGLPLFLIVGASVSSWGPVNLADAADIAGGTSAEDSGVGRLLWQTARYGMLVAVAAMGGALFLGGWWGPLLPGPFWVILKTVVLLLAFLAAGHLLARVRTETFVVVSWAVLIPLALVNIFFTGAFLL
ncbi:MAG: NADH-quinone oxidoreductase subunit H [Dehalococcoidia bacterium]|nr:NADH-quinone oxidoreductase subunit H [Dehalococcoidia bacterium]